MSDGGGNPPPPVDLEAVKDLNRFAADLYANKQVPSHLSVGGNCQLTSEDPAVLQKLEFEKKKAGDQRHKWTLYHHAPHHNKPFGMSLWEYQTDTDGKYFGDAGGAYHNSALDLLPGNNGTLHINRPVVFEQGVTFKQPVSFDEVATFKNKVKFTKQIDFNSPNGVERIGHLYGRTMSNKNIGNEIELKTITGVPSIEQCRARCLSNENPSSDFTTGVIFRHDGACFCRGSIHTGNDSGHTVQAIL